MSSNNNNNSSSSGSGNKSIGWGRSGRQNEGYEQLNQSLTGVTRDTVLPATVATPMIEVVAPATMPENFTFEAEVGGRSFTVMVPTGGVEEGQKFTVPLPGGADSINDAMVLPRTSVPVGQWKDGLCDCCIYGVFHPLLWNSMCCTPVALAQVMTRMKELTWLGTTGTVAQTAGTFRIMVFIVLFYWLFDRLLWLLFLSASTYEQENTAFWLRLLLFLMYFGYTAYAMKNTRAYIRSKYAIPESRACPTGSEDACCSVCCMCCTVAQMARHTADYDTYRGVCCNDTGLPSNAPEIA